MELESRSFSSRKALSISLFYLRCHMKGKSDTICAISTAPGVGGIAVIRISGDNSFKISQKIFSGNVREQESMSVKFGMIMDGEHVIDEVLLSKFISPRTFTGEDVIEISCHGSIFIQQEILRVLIEKGCRMADHGEFTKRAFLNGKMDLSQAEAVADLIASESAAQHNLAMSQMKGGFSKDISALRQKLLDFSSLIELELDFSEEDVEFADRKELYRLVGNILSKVTELIDSFRVGNVIKTGIPVAIIGPPNSGKSTLLNALLKEDRAIVSEIAGTTRDAIEDRISIDGILFRFIDTAGLRETEDVIENQGIKLALEKAKSARVILFLYDASESNLVEMNRLLSSIERMENGTEHLMILANKCDKIDTHKIDSSHLLISAKSGTGLVELKTKLVDTVGRAAIQQGNHIVTNVRHYSLLIQVSESILQVKNGMDSELSSDLLALEIRRSLHYLGELTGEISTEDILGNIFSRFCIGK